MQEKPAETTKEAQEKPLRAAYRALPGNNTHVLQRAIDALTAAGKLNQMGNPFTINTLYAVMDERANTKDVAEAILDAITEETAKLAAIRERAKQLTASTSK